MENEESEIVSEDLDDSVVAEEQAGASISKLKGKVKEAEAKAREYLDGWQRAQAEFVNIRKRDEEAKQEFLKYANSDLLTQLLPVLDSLELSLPHGNKELEVIYKQFLSILKSNGFVEDVPLGQMFDPRKHESIGMVETGKPEEENQILEVVQKGYMIDGKIIRPAKVKIGTYHV